MKIGFLFSGQGSQTVGMGKDLYENYLPAKKVYDSVERITGIPIKDISFMGPEEELNKTKNTQLAVLTESLAIVQVLKENNIKADMSAGLSLGEYTALIEDEVISFEDGVRLVKKRGEIMQEFTPKGQWKMAAILGIDDEKVIEACKKVKNGFVSAANFNTIGQVVISGDEKAVEQASIFAKEFGAKKVSVLKTEGPFHTEKLQECSNMLRKELEKIKINHKNSHVVKNVNGEIYDNDDNLVDILSNHIISPVKFSNCLTTMYENGIDTFIEIGPSRTLSGFVKRMKFEKQIKIFSINDRKSLEDVINTIRIIKSNLII